MEERRKFSLGKNQVEQSLKDIYDQNTRKLEGELQQSNKMIEELQNKLL